MVVTGSVALAGYVTQSAMHQALEPERARFRGWVTSCRFLFGAALILECGIVGALLVGPGHRAGDGLVGGVLVGCGIAYLLDDRFDFR